MCGGSLRVCYLQHTTLYLGSVASPGTVATDWGGGVTGMLGKECGMSVRRRNTPTMCCMACTDKES
jgi:hypothetical protein